MDAKTLKKLVKTCRELGVLNYKGDGFEFTLSHDAPVKAPKKTAKSKAPITPDTEFETDTLTEEQLLMWSSAPGGQPFQEQEGT